jgi:ubiquitin-like protein Pup
MQQKQAVIRHHGDDGTEQEQNTTTRERHDFTDEVDAMLDEIDSVLESDAGAFVNNYVQGNGQ